MYKLYQSLKYTKQKKALQEFITVTTEKKTLKKTVTTLPVVSHWFNYTELEQQAEEVCLTVNLLVRQCENGVMKRNSRGLRANKVFRGKLVK